MPGSARPQRQRPRWHGRRLDDRLGRRAEEQAAVQQPFELVHGRDADLEDEAVVAGEPVALDDLGDLPCEPGDPGKLPRIGTDAGECADRKPRRAGALPGLKPLAAIETAALRKP